MTTTTTLEQIAKDASKPYGERYALVDGHVWQVELSVGGREVILSRNVRVKVRDRNGIVWSGRDGKGAGLRRVTIRRPLNTIATAV